MYTEEAMFEYLDQLRESGETNMFGAGKYLERVFSLSKGEARRVLARWMETFKVRQDAKETK